jgi:tRNA modification GTPase
MSHAETTASLLTPPGSGAIGVVRVSGAEALACLRAVFRTGGVDSVGEAMFNGSQIRLGQLCVGDQVVDDVLVSRVTEKTPPTFDISAHGGVRVLECILTAFQNTGAKVSSSELHNRSCGGGGGQRSGLDCVWPGVGAADGFECEIIEALCRAKTARAAKFLARQRRVFPVALERIQGACDDDPAGARNALLALLTGAEAARFLVDGAVIVLIGPPNSGKSTLFNRLAGRGASIVSSMAGTTRDWVTESVEVYGVPLTICDTAGLHETSDSIERLAIAAGTVASQRADLCLLVLDATSGLEPNLDDVTGRSRRADRLLTVANKCDLVPEATVSSLCANGPPGTVVRLSALKGTGLDAIVRMVFSRLGFDSFDDTRPVAFTARQQNLLAGGFGIGEPCSALILDTIRKLMGR